MGQVHSDSGPHRPRSPLQIVHLSPARQEAPTVCSNARGTTSPGTAGSPGHADEWPETDPRITWEDYGPKPEVLKGYVLNEGADYIPFDIRLPNGETKPAKYIKVEYGEDPLIVADDFGYVCLDKGKRKLVNVVDNSKHNAETSHAQRLKQ